MIICLTILNSFRIKLMSRMRTVMEMTRNGGQTGEGSTNSPGDLMTAGAKTSRGVTPMVASQGGSEIRSMMALAK